MGFCKTQYEGETKGQIKEREERIQTLFLTKSRNVPRKKQLSSSKMEMKTCSLKHYALYCMNEESLSFTKEDDSHINWS